MSDTIIDAKDLTKTFARKKGFLKKEVIIAVDHIDLKIKQGEIFGLIGPTGAGKTTTLKILSTLILPDYGFVTIDGVNIIKNPSAVKKKIGVMVGEFSRALYWRLSGKRNLQFFASLKEVKSADKRITELVDLFGLKKWENELVMKYSTGMKHKLALAVVLLNDPPILFLDEPLVGIDPLAAREIKNLIKNTFIEKTVIWTSHNLFEIEEMCDRIAILNNGKIVLDGNPNQLKRDYWGYEKIVLTSDKPDAFSTVKNAEIKRRTVEIKTGNITKTFLEIANIVKKKKVKLDGVAVSRPELEEIFVSSVKDVQ